MQVSFKQLYAASRNCRRGKAKGRQCQQYEAKLLENLLATEAALQSYTWRSQPMRCFIATNGSKPREIHAPAYSDRIVHHWLVPQLRALIEPKFIYDCAANIKAKGTHFAVQRLQRMFRQVSAGAAGVGVGLRGAGPQISPAYFLQLDIHNFFYSINHAILLQLLARHLKRACRNQQISQQTAYDLYWLCKACLQVQVPESALSAALPAHKRLKNTAEGCGLPIGNLTSQFFSNVYMNELDQFVKHRLKCRHYVRYVDDFVLVHQSPQQLQQWQAQIETFIAEKLALRLKPEIVLQPVASGADFLGYIVRPHYLLVRRRVVANWLDKLQAWWLCTNGVGLRGVRPLIVLPSTALSKLQAICASYWGHCHHASYYGILTKVFAAMPWLHWFYTVQGGRLTPKWQNPRLTRFKAQCQWFLQQYPQCSVWLQKGRQFVNAATPSVAYPLAQLQGVLRRQQFTGQAYVWVSEQGYTRTGIKHRQLSQIFNTSGVGLRGVRPLT